MEGNEPISFLDLLVLCIIIVSSKIESTSCFNRDFLTVLNYPFQFALDFPKFTAHLVHALDVFQDLLTASISNVFSVMEAFHRFFAAALMFLILSSFLQSSSEIDARCS